MPSWKTVLVGVLVAGSVPVLEALTTYEPEKVTDYRVWAVGLGAAFVRQAAVALIAVVASRRAG